MTTEFHDELYGFIQERTQCLKEQDMDDLLEQKFGIAKNKQWIPERAGIPLQTRNLTLPVFIRNKIHHPENKTMQAVSFNGADLNESIQHLIKIADAVKLEKPVI